MRIMLSLVCLATACSSLETSTTDQASRIDFYELFGPDNVIESVLVRGDTCGILFLQTTDPAADTLAFWTVGVDAIRRDLPYPDADRPNFYAIFTPSNTTLNHTVEGFEAFDHYHVADRASQSSTDDLWDAFIVNPGPNYNAASYRVATSVKEMEQQIAAGILAAPVSTVDAGLGPVVFHAPIACDDALRDWQKQ